jgi:hypothetical protein
MLILTSTMLPETHLPMHSKIRPIVHGWQLQQYIQFADPFGGPLGTIPAHTSITVVLRLVAYDGFVCEQMRLLDVICIIAYSLSSSTK